MVIARSRHLLAFDNVSSIDPELKDAICRLATGSGHAARKLYSDNETIVWSASRPIILNSIETLLVADDLSDRAIGVTLPHIPEHQRIREADLMRDFERVRFEILGALLDAASCALEMPPPSRDSRLPRMADFAHFAASACSAWGDTYDGFLECLRANRRDAIERGLDVDPLAQTIAILLTNRQSWQGTALQLLNDLHKHAPSKFVLEALPQKARGLGGQLRRLAPALRSTGIEFFDLGRTSIGFQVRLARISPQGDARDEHHERSTLSDLREKLKKAEIEKLSTFTTCTSFNGGQFDDKGVNVKPDIEISAVQIRLVENGTGSLLGWAACTIARSVRLEDIGIRKGDRGLFLTYPRKATVDGAKRSIYYPVSQEAAQALQDAIVSRLATLGRVAAANGEGER